MTLRLLLLALTSAAPAAAQVAELRGVDLYRSRHLSTAGLQAKHAPLLDSIATAVAAQDMEAIQATMSALGRRVRDDVRPLFIDLAPIQYFHGDITVWYLTVDVVDSLDAHRLDFAPEPVGQVEGVESVLAIWRAFEEAGWERRAFHDPGQRCPVLHCLFSFEDPELRPFLAELRRGATEHADALERVLAFIAEDPGADVIPLEPVMRLIDGPTTTDRNKALAVLAALSEDPSTHATILRTVGSRLLDLLRLEQPNNHDFAYRILTRVSGRTLDPRDYAAWERWLGAGG